MNDVYNATPGTDDECLCSSVWSTTLATSLVAVLPCRHAICGDCYAQWDVECPVCREPLPVDGPDKFVAAAIAVTPSLLSLARRLPFPAAAAERVVVKLIQANGYDVGLVEELLYGMVERHAAAAARIGLDDDEAGAVDAPAAAAAAAAAHPDDAVARQAAVYAAARAPVRAAAAARRDAATALEALCPTEAASVLAAARARVDAADHVLTAAREGSAAAIYATMNAGMAAGTDGSAEVVLDFHGLHADEARSFVKDMIAPVLAAAALRSVIVITGRGRHSASGVGVLRDAVVDAVREVRGLTALAVENAGRLRLVGERYGNRIGEHR